jgi:hypothetical protein
MQQYSKLGRHDDHLSYASTWIHFTKFDYLIIKLMTSHSVKFNHQTTTTLANYVL